MSQRSTGLCTRANAFPGKHTFGSNVRGNFTILHTDDTFTTFYIDQTAGTLELFFKINIESVIICISFLDLQNIRNQFNQNSPQCQ